MMTGEKKAPPATVRRPPTPAAMAVLECELPVIAAVNGSAVGWGMELALYADIRLASEKASFAELFIRRGLICDVGGLLRLPAIVGPAKAAELLYTGDVIDAAEAGRIGLVSEVTPHGDLMPKAMDLAGRIARNSPLALRFMKEGLRRYHPWRSARDRKLGHRGDLQTVRHRGSPRGRAQFSRKARAGIHRPLVQEQARWIRGSGLATVSRPRQRSTNGRGARREVTPASASGPATWSRSTCATILRSWKPRSRRVFAAPMWCRSTGTTRRTKLVTCSKIPAPRCS